MIRPLSLPEVASPSAKRAAHLADASLATGACAFWLRLCHPATTPGMMSQFSLMSGGQLSLMSRACAAMLTGHGDVGLCCSKGNGPNTESSHPAEGSGKGKSICAVLCDAGTLGWLSSPSHCAEGMWSNKSPSSPQRTSMRPADDGCICPSRSKSKSRGCVP